MLNMIVSLCPVYANTQMLFHDWIIYNKLQRYFRTCAWYRDMAFCANCYTRRGDWGIYYMRNPYYCFVWSVNEYLSLII